MHGTLTILATFICLIVCQGYQLEDGRHLVPYKHTDYYPDLAILALLEDSLDGNEYDDIYGSLYEKRQIPQPRVGRSIPVPRVGRSIPQPRVGRSIPKPRIGRGIPQIRVGRSIPQPRIGRSIPQPRIGRGIPQPRVGRDSDFDKMDFLKLLSLPESQEAAALLSNDNEQISAGGLLGRHDISSDIYNKFNSRGLYTSKLNNEEIENSLQTQSLTPTRLSRVHDEESSMSEMHSEAKEE